MNTSPQIGAVILAGGRIPATLAHRAAHRALLKVGGRFLLDYLCATLSKCPSIRACALVAPAGALVELAALPCARVPAGDTLVENMLLGAKALPPEVTHILYITGDIPLVTVEGLEAYIAASVQSGASLTYPIIPREACEARFPGAKRTYVIIREGTFTGGNAIFTTRALLDERQALIQGLYAARKQPIKLAALLGFSTIWKMLTGALTLPYLEAVATRILGAPARALITPSAEIGFDVDKEADLLAVEQAMRIY